MRVSLELRWGRGRCRGGGVSTLVFGRGWDVKFVLRCVLGKGDEGAEGEQAGVDVLPLSLSEVGLFAPFDLRCVDFWFGWFSKWTSRRR
jgi:hypothetical protein